MRRLISKLRPLHFVAAAFVLLVGAWKGAQYAQRNTRSPFVLWGFRAGMRFTELDETVFRHTSSRFRCREPMQSIRLCEIRVSGIRGVIRVLVDGAGRAARLQFQPDSASPIMREEGRRIAAYWNRVNEGVGDPRGPRDPISTTRWSTADNRWAALMRYGLLGKTPFDIQLTDRRALTSVARTSALAPTVLVMNAIAESTDVMGVMDDVTYTIRSIQFGRALDASLETPVQSSDVLLPSCERVRLRLGVQTSSTRDQLFSPSTAAVLERAVAKAYSGLRLVVGESTWLVDSAGNAERIRLGPMEGDESRRIIVVAVQYPTRASSAMVRLREGRPEAFCRATAEVLIAESLPNGELGTVHRIPIAEEAVASSVSGITVIPTNAAGDTAHVRIRYRTTHGTFRWMGSLDWEGVIAGDPPRLRGRVPLGFEQFVEAPLSGKFGTLLITKRAPKSISLGTLEQFDWGFSTRTISVPVSPNGALDAVRILDRLF